MICNPLTMADIAGPQGPFLLEVLLRDATGSNPRWVLQQSVKTLQEGLRVASRMEQAYRYRLYLSPADGYLYLEWRDDDNGETCSPVWERK